LDGAGVFGGISVSEIVRPISIEWEIGSKERRIQARLGVVEEGLLLNRSDYIVLELTGIQSQIYLPVLMLLNANPSRPSDASCTN
jgi:hypothetical protein